MLNTSLNKTEQPLSVGVTGGIGSGKSLVCKIFGTFGIPVFEADKEARLLLEKDDTIRKQLSHLLGNEIFPAPGIVDRAKMAGIIFNDPYLLSQVNLIVHPAVRDLFASWRNRQQSAYVIQEAAILFETGGYHHMDLMVHVSAPEATRINRVTERDRISPEQVRTRMANQWTDERKSALADFVILNDGSHFLIKQVIEIHNKIVQHGKIC